MAAIMRKLYLTILTSILLSSCLWDAYPESDYVFSQGVKDLYIGYHAGDTMIFADSANNVDSFVITGVDSVLENQKGLMMSPRNSKYIYITYQQIPTDYWKRNWIEMGPNNEKRTERSADGFLFSAVYYPDRKETEYWYDFLGSYLMNSELPKLQSDTLQLRNFKFTNYYIIENLSRESGNPDEIQKIYSTAER
ncbi:MAG: hypothetical protein EOO88_19410, partial [Pedobacter sp.]